MKHALIGTLASLVLFCLSSLPFSVNAHVGPGDPYGREQVVAAKDTVPLKDRTYDFTSPGKRNPFDLKDPRGIDKNIEYDLGSGKYLINEKIGSEYFRMPSYMSFEEYLKYRSKQQEKEYFDKLSGVSTATSRDRKKDPLSKLADNDPLKKIDLKNQLLDRLFGGTTVDIKPQGNIDLTFGGFYQKVENPILPLRAQRQGGFDFDMNIRVNVTGKIGEKLTLSTNYNTQATFDFENQMKLKFDSKNFSEDDILQNIEAGNVSMPLRGQLIQGVQSLFGVKTELQFGYLRLTGLASQQRSQRQNIKLQGGSQVQQFNVFADQYDENRHFFLSHLNRSLFEPSMKNLPQVNTGIKITRLELWVTNDRNATENVREIVALADIGERDPNNFTGQSFLPPPLLNTNPDICNPNALPDNGANDIYKSLITNPRARKLESVVSVLQSGPYNYFPTREFEKIRARKLDPSEYTFHDELGFVSLNVNLRPNQVLAAAYEYTYNGEKTYKVGEFGNDAPGNTDTLGVLFVKLLKGQTVRVDLPVWDLMMKNVYSTGAYQANRESFRLDIFYQDPVQGAEKRFLPEQNLKGTPLLTFFNLDNLNIQGDPQPDGIFDYIPGVTINPKTGRILFPLLEPFGSSLKQKIVAGTGDPTVANKYVYQELYDSTITWAREYTEKNRFIIRGSYKSSISSEIALGGINIPRNSVRVTAGSNNLVEGVDYEVDYTIGRVRILNDAFLNSGLPINVSYEDNTLFGFQNRTLLGTRADYDLGKALDIGNLHVGATYLHLFERPFTPKVNIGDDPINNRIYGFDVQYNTDAPWLTKLVDKLPLIQTKQPSSISFTGESAILKPGHASAIEQSKADSDGALYIDDFEGSTSGFDLRTPVNAWALASVPQRAVDVDGKSLFPESELINNTLTGVNRARLNWYRIDLLGGGSSSNDPYTLAIDQQKLFPQTFFQPGQNTTIQPFDLHYVPFQRGPYNFDIPDGTTYSSGMTPNGLLKNPASRWGGIMRALTTTDFEQANIEFIEFWMMSPFLSDVSNKGNLYIHLGNVSEDIMRDSRNFYENGLPTQINNQLRTDTTRWSRIPRAPLVVNAFDIDTTSRRLQDVGFDGMNNDGERVLFKDYLDAVRGKVDPNVYSTIEADPSNDDFKYFGDYPSNTPAFDRYSRFNNPEGNSRVSTGQFVESSTNYPDAEDLNRDNSLNESENYYQYAIPLVPDGKGGIKLNNYISDTISYEDQGQTLVWYRFRVPVTEFSHRIGDIRDFRAIQFIRLFLNGFEREVTLRFARFELGRNQWRRYRRPFTSGVGLTCRNDTEFDLNKVNIEENSARKPFNYVLPLGIFRERQIGPFPNALQNEQSLALRVNNLHGGDARGIYKIINMDLRVFKKLKMFVHAEEITGEGTLKKGDLSVFIRLGSDFENNYYEYEIPLQPSDPRNLPNNNTLPEYSREVWPDSNAFDFPLSLLVDVKEKRNAKNFPLVNSFEDTDPNKPGSIVRIKGNPNLGLVKGFMVGIRNPHYDDCQPYSAEVWINELRVTGLDERGGFASIARLDLKLADLGTVTLSGNYGSIGWGSIDQRLAQRAREEVLQYDVATNLELGKFLPAKSGIRVPFYAQYSNNTRTPQFDPYDLDIELKEKLRQQTDAAKRDSIRKQAITVTEIRTINFTNVRKERSGGGRGAGPAKKPMPWDIENFSVSYNFSETTKRDPIIESDRLKIQRGQLDYTFARPAAYVTPLKKLIKKDKYLKFLSDFNFNPLPSSFTFGTLLERHFQETRYRFAGEEPSLNTYYNKRFMWTRNYNLQWDFSRSLKFTFSAVGQSVIDEPNEFKPDGARLTDAERNEVIWNNMQKLGRPKNYNHSMNLTYTVPFKNIPLMDWVTVKAQYGATYAWNAAALNVDSLGNVIQNTQTFQINGDLNFEGLYNQWGYLKKINTPRQAAPPQPKRRERITTEGRDTADKPAETKTKRKKPAEKEYEPGILERILIRPLMVLRKARLVYDEKRGTIVPGFMPVARLMGQQDLSAPGWEFIAGFQPNRAWLDDAAVKGWMTRSVYLNQQVVQNNTQTFSATVNLEPIPDFRLDIDVKRDYTHNYSEFFKRNCDSVYTHNPETAREVGSYSVSYFAMNTLFKDKLTDLVGLFKQFENNRVIISERLAGPNAGAHEKDAGYKKGFGKFQQDVLIPAFLSAYTGQDARTINTNLFKTMPLPNWKLNYNGLSKLPFLKDIAQTITITHGYRSTMTVNSYQTDLQFKAADPTILNPNTASYYSRLAIPNLVINEQFSPLLGMDVRLKNDMTARVEYKKSRNLALGLIDYQLAETKTTEYVIGFGYRVRNVRLTFLDFLTNIGSAPQPKKKKEKKDNTRTNQPPPVQSPSGASSPNDLNFKFDVSYRDDVTFNHILDQNITTPTRGLLSVRITPSIDYSLNKRLNLRLFVDYSRTVPKTSAAFPITSTRGGLTVRFTL